MAAVRVPLSIYGVDRNVFLFSGYCRVQPSSLSCGLELLAAFPFAMGTGLFFPL